MAFSLSRRALLRGSGAALSLPVLEAMFEKKVFAQVANTPKRFVFVYCGIGPAGEGKEPQSVIPDAPGPFSLPFKTGLEPLEMLKQDTAVISSLRIPKTGSGNGRRYGSTGFHYETMGPLVSGVSQLGSSSSYAGGPSCDWLVAQKIGMATKFPSLVYMVQSAEHTNNYKLDYVSYQPKAGGSSGTLRNDPIISPKVAFDQLFGGGAPAPMTGQAPAIDRELVMRKDILARVQRQYAGLRTKLGMADRDRLDAHVDNIRALEQRLATGNMPLPAGRCTPPANPGADPSEGSGYSDEDGRAGHWVDLIHAAFACDLSRVVSLEITSSMSGIVLPNSLGITYRNWDGSSLPPAPLHEATHGRGNNLSVAEGIRWHMKHVAALAKKLKDTPDVSGNMLDNTVIVFAMEAGLGITGDHAPHTSEGMVSVVVGGKNLGMKLGSHIVADGFHPAGVNLTAMRAVAGTGITALGEISAEIPGLRG